jgi:hypothetical protein
MSNTWKTGAPPSPGWYIASDTRDPEEVRRWLGNCWSLQGWIGDLPKEWDEVGAKESYATGVEWLTPIEAPTEEIVAEVVGEDPYGVPCGYVPRGVPVSVAPPKALDVQEGGNHYKALAIQPVEYIHRNGLGYFEGNVVKYVTRWKIKGGTEDLRKARHYLDLLLELSK